ncbi:ankyrin repeat protein [Diplodia corticola]|uniref:Ankyrin repeat protein n=1 Tax=Diplodia corticola TaxID=236234 RepID=A0A1J9S059_9PEZI|nr:ankyrin repeat protein [Diplodia corticola]OJD33069.1 ankyrin repeat protein [Diplodia corticola]
MESDKILDAVRRARAFRLCLRRIWAVAASLPDKEKSLPTLIPAPDIFSVPGHDRQHHEHEQCTFDFCEHSRVDFTSVAQHHEKCPKDCGHFIFPLEQLEERVEAGRPTAWKLDDRSLLDTSHPYMAVSHVWADGTGAGTWRPGQVNKCLYTFICDIARHFQCEGCWWDTISIPLDDEIRGKALNNMHNNYADARITLVHDLYLREWEWVDAETACFAIAMSPWYSRGWTSLELAKSHKVKILFKARNDEHVIKDLDVDILAEIPPSSRYHATAESIRKLRSASIQSFGDLLAILGPRDTSKPRDVPIISGLLAGVDVSGGLSQQEIYQRILRKLGKVAQGNLFHNSATMSAPGFSWCPTNILDMPMAESDSATLELLENGDLEGMWRVHPADSVNTEDFIWKGTHPLTQVSLNLALNDKNKASHILLVENGKSQRRALLVKPMINEQGPLPLLCCHFVGPVYFSSALDGSIENGEFLEARVRIGSTDGMKELPYAWSSVFSMVKSKILEGKASSLEDTATTGRGIQTSQSQASFDENDTIKMGSKNWKALLYFEEEASKSLFEKSWMLQSSADSGSKLLEGMALHFMNGNDSSNSSVKGQALFYGHQDIIDYIIPWLDKVEAGSMMLLALDEDDKIRDDSDDDPTRDLLASDALLLASAQKQDKWVKPLVTLLLDNNAQHSSNLCGDTPLHLAVEHGCVGIVENLLKNQTNPADADAVNSKKQSAIHIAAEKGRSDVVRLLVEYSKNLNARDDEMGWTALHLAAQKGDEEMVQLLLDRDADPELSDWSESEDTALHHAARRGHEGIVEAVLDHVVNDDWKSAITSHSTASDGGENIDDKTNGDTGKKLDGETNDKVGGDNDRKSDGKNEEGMDPNVPNGQSQTALHLAAEKGHERVVKVLINKGARLCAVDGSEHTALRLAAKNGHAKTVGTLLSQQKSEKFEQSELDNALLLAAAGKHTDTVDKLQKKGARSGPQDSQGMTALHWIIEFKLDCNIKSLIERLEDGDVDKKDDKRQQSALLLAAEKGVRAAVPQLLKKGADVKLKDSEERTALHWAAIGRNVEIIGKLLKSEPKPEVNEQDYQGRTALHWAARSGSIDATMLLLDADMHDVTEDKHGQSALIFAACNGQAATVKALLDRGSPPKAQDHEQKTALDWAATIGSDAVVRQLLPKIEVDESRKKAMELAANGRHLSVATLLYESIKDPKVQASVFPTVLFLASATKQYSSVVRKLIGSDFDLNHTDKRGRTALMLAVENRNRRLTSELLDLKAETDLKDTEGKTALMIATQLDEWEMVGLLLRANADPDVQDKRNYTALHYAIEAESYMGVDLLLSKANPDIPDFRNRTALHTAIERFGLGRPEFFRERRRKGIVKLLLYHGVGLDLKDGQGQTPLHLAVLKDRYDIVELLLPFEDGAISRPMQQTHALDSEDADGRTPLLLAAEKGYYFLVDYLLNSGFRPNAQDKTGQTPLLLAAERGDSLSVKALLWKNADPNLRGPRGRTPLFQAARNGHEEIVRTLLEKENVNLDARDAMGRTALLLAAENGHADIVKELLDRAANSTIADYEGKKAWQKAMDKGHASVVGRLLSVPDAPIQDRKSVNEALLLASRRGWVTLVEVLLEKKADVIYQSREGWTALHMAAMSGHQEVVQKLLKKDLHIIIRDGKGRTALMQATEHGFESIVGILLERDEVKTNIDGWMGREALLFAAEKGYTGIVKLLLENSVDCNTFDSEKRTAMARAAANGHGAIVELLLQRKANSAIKDDHDRTVLHHAAWGGYDDVVSILLKNEVDFSASDSRGQSALHLAAERASKEVVERLLEKRANVNARSMDGQTVLHRAAWGGSCEVVKLLRQNGADPFIRDNSENKPWQVAAEKGHESIVQVLLEEEESVYDERILARKGLIFAAQMGYADIASSLLKKGAESAVKDKDGLTPLHWAAARGDKVLVDLLIREGDGLIDKQDCQRRTALCLGVIRARAAVVETLLQCDADANIPDEKGRTALHHAAETGNWEIVHILLNHQVDPHIRDCQKKKAWQLAAEAGYHQIVRLLLDKEVVGNSQSQKKEELFLRMAEEGMMPMVQVLLEKGVNKDAKDRFGRVAIGLAAEHSKDEVLELLLSKGANPGIPDLRKQTPLLWAAKAGNSRIISSILGDITPTERSCNESTAEHSNALPNSTKDVISKAEILNHTDSEGRTALSIAVENQHENAVRLLLVKGSPDIDVNVQDIAGRTALHLAAENGNRNLVQLLLKKKAKQDIQDDLGRTALLLAAEHEKYSVVEALLEASVDYLDVSDSHKRTPLQVATERGNKDIIQLLLSSGADTNLVDEEERTALLLAAENGDKEAIDLLLKNGANREHGDVHKRTPLLLAVANGDKAVVETLLGHPNYDMSIKDRQEHDQNLLRLAVQSGNKEVAWLIARRIASNTQNRGANEERCTLTEASPYESSMA